MNHYKKRLIKNGIAAPVIIAMIVTVVFFALLSTAANDNHFFRRINLSNYEQSDIIQAEQIHIESNYIAKSQLDKLESNTVLGTISDGNKSLPLILNANSVNAMGKFNILKDSKIIGETGCTYAYCAKADNELICGFSQGDIVNASLCYGNYTFEVVDVKNCDCNSIKNIADGISSALVLYTDANEGVGISNSYLVVICKLTDGIKITQ